MYAGSGRYPWRSTLVFRRTHDSSGLAEEKEEDGGQRRPEKRKEPLEERGSDPLFWRAGKPFGYFEGTLTTFRPSCQEAFRRPYPGAFLQDHLGLACFHPLTRTHRRP